MLLKLLETDVKIFNFSLSKHGIVASGVGFKAVTDSLILLHVHFIHALDGYGINRPWGARGSGSGKTLERSGAMHLRRMHMYGMWTIVGTDYSQRLCSS
jgi:hypothetical protein